MCGPADFLFLRSPRRTKPASTATQKRTASANPPAAEKSSGHEVGGDTYTPRHAAPLHRGGGCCDGVARCDREATTQARCTHHAATFTVRTIRLHYRNADCTPQRDCNSTKSYTTWTIDINRDGSSGGFKYRQKRQLSWAPTSEGSLGKKLDILKTIY